MSPAGLVPMSTLRSPWSASSVHVVPYNDLDQLRHVLDVYQANGGAYTEVVFADCGHSPQIEKPGELKDALLSFIQIGQTG